MGFRISADAEDPAFRELRIGRGLADMLTTVVLETGRFRLIEGQAPALAALRDEQWISRGGALDSGAAATSGKRLGCSYVIWGDVGSFTTSKTSGAVGLATGHRLTTRITVDVYFLDVASGRIVSIGTGEGTETTSAQAIAGFWEEGVEQFDQTTIGKASRQACAAAVEKALATMAGAR